MRAYKVDNGSQFTPDHHSLHLLGNYYKLLCLKAHRSQFYLEMTINSCLHAIIIRTLICNLLILIRLAINNLH